MMKTLCVAAVLLSLTSMCQPASLACEKLLKPVDKTPHLPGSWYVIAVSTQNCFIATLLNSVLWPSVNVNITSEDTPNVYNAIFKVKMYGYCESESEDFLYENNTMTDVDDIGTGEPDVLLQSCPDCFTIKQNDNEMFSALMLFSRRQNVSAAELKEFETQAECLGWSKPQLLNTDHDYENCGSLDDDDVDSLKLSSMILQRLKSTYTLTLKCLVETLLYYPSLAIGWPKIPLL